MADKKILRVLIVDDSPDDAELTVVTLRKDGGYMLKSQRVQDLNGFQTALEKGDWDLIVSEHSLPHFSAQLAFDVVRSSGRDVPFLVFTRKIKDADLVKIMRAGVHDVIHKDQPARFVPVVERELRMMDQRRQYHKAIAALKEVESKHRAVVDGAREALCYSQDGMHVDANKAYLDLFAYENMGELEGVPVMNLIDKGDHARFKDYMRKHGDGEAQEFLALRKGGARFHIEIALSPITLNGEECVQLLCTDVSKRKAVETKLQYLNQHDALTGLYNRAYLLQELNKAVERAKAGDGAGGIVYIDFYELKQVTNQLGHVASDRFLLKAVKVLRESLGETALLARFGDHEFAAYVRDVNEKQVAVAVAALQQALADAAFTDSGHAIHCNFRIASGRVDTKTESMQKILSEVCRPVAPSEPSKRAAAPAATPTAAPAAPKPVPVSVPVPAAAPASKAPVAAAPLEPKAPAVTPVAPPAAAAAPSGNTTLPRAPGEWHDRLESALKKDGFQLTYQPMVSLHGDSSEYFEVLVRMLGRNDELIAAGEFMPPAEQSGQSMAIDRWVVRQAVRALADLHGEGREATFFVNLSATVLKDHDMPATLESALREFKMAPKFLVFELDEPVVIAQPAAVATFMKTLKRMGCALCVDNFGRTLGTLNHLRNLPVEYLKIDGALVRNVGSDAVGQAAFRAVVEVAKALNKKTIAKSVESADNLSALWSLGVDYVQGNYFQQADAALDYQFSGETTISSEISVPQWAHTKGKSG